MALFAVFCFYNFYDYLPFCIRRDIYCIFICSLQIYAVISISKIQNYMPSSYAYSSV